jgi:hypothetical protein
MKKNACKGVDGGRTGMLNSPATLRGLGVKIRWNAAEKNDESD